jgi:adenosylcobyric acid synthase
VSALMVQGCTSSAGKSLIATVLCGTWHLLAECDRERIAGWILNRFDAAGLDLLALESTFAPSKRVGLVEDRFVRLPAPWEALSGLQARGYEIRHGSSRFVGDDRGSLGQALPDGLGFVDGPVLGVYPHGLLEDPAIVRALLGATPSQSVEQAIDELAGAVLAHLDLDEINALAGVG